MQRPDVKTPTVSAAGVGETGDVRSIGKQSIAHGAVVNGRGMRAYEAAKALLARDQPELTPAEYSAACREAARLAGV